jgi:hypothetical protein
MQLVACGLLFAVADPPGKALEGSALRQGWEGLLCVFQRPSLRPFALNLSAIGATSFFIFWFYQPKLQEIGLSVAVNGWVAAGMNLSSIAILGRIVWLQGKLGLRHLVLLTAILPGLGFLVMASSLNPLTVICAILLVGACKIAREPIMQNLANAQIESERRATVLSAISMLTRIVIFLMYPVVGFLADQSLALVLVFLGFATLTAAFATQLRSTHLGVGLLTESSNPAK